MRQRTPYIHLEPDSTVLIPFNTLLNMGGSVRSIAINFVTPQQVQGVLENLMPRLGLNLYGGVGNEAYRFSTIGSASSRSACACPKATARSSRTSRP